MDIVQGISNVHSVDMHDSMNTVDTNARKNLRSRTDILNIQFVCLFGMCLAGLSLGLVGSNLGLGVYLSMSGHVNCVLWRSRLQCRT